jgi:DEP domain-containing protein 5
MSAIPPPNSRHGPRRASHLRQVSTGSPESHYNSRPPTRPSDTETQNDSVSPRACVEKRCNLWTHEESFSKHEVVLNLDLFPGVNPGDLMAIVPLKADMGVRDHQEKTQGLKKDSDSLPPSMQRDRSHSNPNSFSQGSVADSRQDIDLENRYLFIAKDMSREIKEKPQGLEVSVAKHVADIFGFKHRSNVLVTTVRLPIS